jgi:colicin import membrane protein
VSLASSKPQDDSNLIPVTIVTDADISRAALGQQNAPPVPKPKPLVDKIGEPKPPQQLAPKVTEKPEITTSTTPPMPQPKPEPKQEAKSEPKPDPKPDLKQEAKSEPKPDPKPDLKQEAKSEPKPDPKPDLKQEAKSEPKPDPKPEPKPKPDPKAVEKPNKKPDDFKPDQIADLLNKKDAQKPAKPQDKPVPDAPKYDASQIAQLLDHREPQRQPAAGATVNSSPGLGAMNAPADAQLSQSEIDALRERIRECWSPPAGVDANSNLYVTLRVLFKPDGSLSQAPVVVSGSASALGPALAESGKRALLQCQPFTMLKPEHYAQWKDIQVNFSPRDLSY